MYKPPSGDERPIKKLYKVPLLFMYRVCEMRWNFRCNDWLQVCGSRIAVGSSGWILFYHVFFIVLTFLKDNNNSVCLSKTFH